jgi:hypothetical protein
VVTTCRGAASRLAGVILHGFGNLPNDLGRVRRRFEGLLVSGVEPDAR